MSTELDREVCEFLRIEPIGTCSPTVKGIPRVDKGQILFYPAVSTSWAGFGLVVEGLKQAGIGWSRSPFGSIRIFDVEGTEVVCIAGNVCGYTLPLALALAVLKLAKEAA